MDELKTINEEPNENYSKIYYYKSVKGIVRMNIKTKDKFLVKLLNEFLLSFNNSKDINNPVAKVFFKMFVDSLDGFIPNCILDFLQQLFFTQYKFFVDLDLKLKNSGNLKGVLQLQHILLAFYRYLENNYTDSIKEIFDDVYIVKRQIITN